MFRLLISVRDKAVCSNLYHFIHIEIWVFVLSSAWGYDPDPCLFSGRTFTTGSTLLLKGVFSEFFGICTFVARNRPEFSRPWVEESNALTQNPRFRRLAVKNPFLKHDFPAPDFECRKSCLNQVGIYGKIVRRSAFARVASRWFWVLREAVHTIEK